MWVASWLPYHPHPHGAPGVPSEFFPQAPCFFPGLTDQRLLPGSCPAGWRRDLPFTCLIAASCAVTFCSKGLLSSSYDPCRASGTVFPGDRRPSGAGGLHPHRPWLVAAVLLTIEAFITGASWEEFSIGRQHSACRGPQNAGVQAVMTPFALLHVEALATGPCTEVSGCYTLIEHLACPACFLVKLLEMGLEWQRRRGGRRRKGATCNGTHP